MQCKQQNTCLLPKSTHACLLLTSKSTARASNLQPRALGDQESLARSYGSGRARTGTLHAIDEYIYCLVPCILTHSCTHSGTSYGVRALVPSRARPHGNIIDSHFPSARLGSVLHAAGQPQNHRIATAADAWLVGTSLPIRPLQPSYTGFIQQLSQN